MRIILTGGGTLGSVTPLLAIAQKLKDKRVDVDFLWVGTKAGPEKELVLNSDIIYRGISAGKLRRYFSLKNLSDIIKTAVAIIQSLFITYSFKPKLIICAGSFVQVPIVFAVSAINMITPREKKIKIIVHQQDVKKGLANSLASKFADKITVSTKKSLTDFPKLKTVLTGNPYRAEILNGQISHAIKLFKINPKKPTLLILGGGTGALRLNQLVTGALPKLLTFCQIIHITGKNKQTDGLKSMRGYYQTEFLKSPLIKNATINLECKLHKEVDVGDHYMFIGEVIAAHYNEGKKVLLNMKKINGARIFEEF